VYPKRFSQDDEQTQDTATPVMAETFRSASAPPAVPPPTHNNDEHKISVFWRVFGGTILSIVALVAITIFNNLQGSISELRAEATRNREALAAVPKREDLDREREARAGLAKKEDVDARVKSLYERIRVIEAFKVDIEAVKERANSATTAVDALKKDVGTSVDALKRDTAGIEVMRERLTILSAETKLATEAAQRVQSEVEKNKASDLERKLFRDAQAKTLDDSLRELQRAVQDCREKLARLEGAGPPAPRPSAPKTGESKTGD
jgi:DNA repair exonuclease SbcCD ATPase subunit